MGWTRSAIDEAVWVGAEGLVEGLLAGGVDVVGLSVVNLIGGHEADAEMMIVLVVPIEEGSAKRSWRPGWKPKRLGNWV